MSILKTKIALESRLASNFPSVQIAPESVTFFAPPNASYFRLNLQIGKPDDPVLGSKYRRENLVFQVFCIAETNKGTAAALTLAEQVQGVFQRGTFISVDNLRIHVFTTPQVGSSVVANNRLVVPVFIPVTVEVQV